jgi:hypothetical protein
MSRRRALSTVSVQTNGKNHHAMHCESWRFPNAGLLPFEHIHAADLYGGGAWNMHFPILTHESEAKCLPIPHAPAKKITMQRRKVPRL